MRQIRDIVINGEKLEDILKLHEDWLNGINGGKRANLEDANLENANLRYADLRGANLENANLEDANLEDANLEDANLRGANLGYANLRGANLENANLEDANLRYANLEDANLGYANLRGANLGYANLRGADLDFSCMPLWCGDLKANYDDKQIIQQLYHVMSHIKYSNNASDEIKELLNEVNLKWANKFHRVEECGEVKHDSSKSN